jgi:hypothetical protein
MEELLFVPSTRLRDRIEYGDEIFHQYNIGNGFSEVELTARGQDLVMNGQCTWKDFAEALENNIVWIDGNVYLDVCHLGGFGDILNYGHVLSVDANGESIDTIHVEVWASSTAQASRACHVLFRLLTTSGARMVENDSTAQQSFDRPRCPISGLAISYQGSNRPICPFSGLALSQLIQQCPSLIRLYFSGFSLQEEIVHALWPGAGNNIEIVLESCRTAISGTVALVESLQRNLGPTQLIGCDIFPSASALADGLSGNDKVKLLKLSGGSLITEGNMRKLVLSLSHNQGLEELDFDKHTFSDENWGILCQSLTIHPSLKRMDVSRPMNTLFGVDVGVGGPIFPLPGGNEAFASFNESSLSEAQKTRRAEKVLEMLKVNTVLHNITLTFQDYNEQILHDEIHPRLLVNRYRPRVRELKGTQDDNLRAKLLGRALHSVNKQPNLLWMFLTSHKEHLLRGIQE